jgi:type II secretory pathway predicted ATPase ExeA
MEVKIDTKNHPAVLALAAFQEKHRLTNGVLARRYLRCSDATWSTLKSGTYPGEKTGPWLEKIEAALRLIEDEASGPAAAAAEHLLDLDATRDVINSVRACATDPRNRLVAYLAATGGGKSKLARRLRTRLGDTVVALEATETWGDSYYAAALGVASALKLQDAGSNMRSAEAAVIAALEASPRLLALDEAHHCGRAALNLLKLILNRTPSRVLMLALPELWGRMQRKNWEEAQQLRNRTYAKFVMHGVGDADCRLFLAAKLPGFAALDPAGAAARDIAAACRAAANRFGLFNTLQCLCSETAEELTPGSPLTPVIARAENLRS